MDIYNVQMDTLTNGLPVLCPSPPISTFKICKDAAKFGYKLKKNNTINLPYMEVYIVLSKQALYN